MSLSTGGPDTPCHPPIHPRTRAPDTISCALGAERYACSNKQSITNYVYEISDLMQHSKSRAHSCLALILHKILCRQQSSAIAYGRPVTVSHWEKAGAISGPSFGLIGAACV